MIAVARNVNPVPSQIVHAVSYSSDVNMGFQLGCDAPWALVNSTYHARVLTEVDPTGRTMTVSLTRDPVDCMSCLVAQARR